MQCLGVPSNYGLDHHGIYNVRTAYWNLYPPALIEQIIDRKEGSLANQGAVLVNTGNHTGRAPNDKYLISEHDHSEQMWWGRVNKPYDSQHFKALYRKILAYLENKDIFIQDMMAGAHPRYQRAIRIITEYAWHSLFSRDLFLRLPPDKLTVHVPEYTLICCPGFFADPSEDHTRSGAFIIVNFEEKIVLIGGTSYAGEIKKSIFTMMNAEMPQAGVLSMHCSANVGKRGDVALFFGLSGTGKTTLSSHPDRRLIGDDEHGWSEEGIFNFEGGCYAKTIHLRPDLEPIIWEATHQFGSVLENVVFNEVTRKIDFEDSRYTENTRGAYPLDYVANHVTEGYAGHPKNIFFLTADAFGVMPPIARLNAEQAMYYFLSGYTSKLAGTEKGLGQEPLATFSTCFAAPFLPLQPHVYAEMLVDKILRHQVRVWLINTGWTGGSYTIGNRIRLPYTRAMVSAVLAEKLDQVAFHIDPYFGLSIPNRVPGVPAKMLQPVYTWNDRDAYEQQATRLVERFEENFDQFRENVPSEVVYAGPRA